MIWVIWAIIAANLVVLAKHFHSVRKMAALSRELENAINKLIEEELDL